MVRHGPPDWDVSRKGHYQRRLKEQDAAGINAMYSSDYFSTYDFLQNDRNLNRALYRHTNSLYRALRSEIGRDEGTGGYHLQDVPRMRRVRRGGKDNDRQAYHIFVVNPSPEPNSAGHAFLAAERMSQFSKEAWKARRGSKTQGIPANPSIPPNRDGWVERALKRTGRPEARRNRR